MIACCCSDATCRLYGCKQFRQQSQPIMPRGCICPPGAEKTCQGFGCPRKGYSPAGGPTCEAKP